MNDFLHRTELLIGKKKLQRLCSSKVFIAGLGGVGSYCAEILVRSGIGQLIICDFDTVEKTNINRQLIALNSNIGMYKTDVFEMRAKDINPDINIIKVTEKFNAETSKVLTQDVCYVIDCIDDVAAKVELIKYSRLNSLNVISAMGAGNKLDPTRIRVTDIYSTNVCPLARVIRQKLRKLDIDSVKVAWSDELPKKNNNDEKVTASIATVPSVMGIIIASEVIIDILGDE